MTLLIPLLDKLPPSIRIGPHDFTFVRKTHSQMFAQRPGRSASFSSWVFEICVVMDEHPLSDIVDSLWHEINHGIWWVYGIQNGDTEERIAGIMGTALTAIYRDNPRFAHWLADAATMMADAKG